MCPIKSGTCLDDPEKPNRLVLASRSFIKIEYKYIILFYYMYEYIIFFL